ncbi:MAG: pilus assembly protein PilM [Candidatus Pacebacteria bacterium]|nr:pilus assembly protein PilM [Candidatus Paceibacterota bacterium]
MKSRLFDFFPVPRILAMQTTGVAVSDDVLHFVKLGEDGLSSYGETKLPENVIEYGSVANPGEFVKILTDLRRKYNLDLVEVSIPEEKSYLFKTTVLGENTKDIRSNLELHLQENVPFKINEVVFDFSIISSEGNSHEVIVSVLPVAVVNQYLGVFKEASLSPLSFQVESQAVTQAVVKRNSKENVLVINLHDGNKAGFYIVDGKNVVFSSTVDVDGEDSVHIFDGVNDQKTSKKDDFGVLIRETKKIMTYWKTHDGKSISKIIVTGNISDENKIIDQLSGNLSIRAEIANVWQNAFSFDEIIPKMKRKDSLRFAASIGLALPNQ